MQSVRTAHSSPGWPAIALLLLALSAASWFVGRHATVISDLFISAYLQHYDAATATPGGKLEYYVTSDQRSALQALIDATNGLDDLRETRFANLYTVSVSAASKRTLANRLRDAPFVSAVFNIPFFCH